MNSTTSKVKKTQSVLIPKKAKKVITRFRPRVRSRHDSHDPLRTDLPLMPFRSVVRLGSTTSVEDIVEVECNSIASVKNSSSKLLMKQCFERAQVSTAVWCNGSDIRDIGTESISTTNANQSTLRFPLIIKSHYGSRGRGNSKINNAEELRTFINAHQMGNYIVEEFKTYAREYRLHVTEDGCFYTCRKMLKRDCPEEKKFQRHDDNCVWIMEDNPSFDKPVNWDNVVADCVKALKSLGLDIGAFDLKIQSAKDRDGRVNQDPQWIVIESCSAPSFGTVTLQKYIQEIPKVLSKKHQQNRGL